MTITLKNIRPLLLHVLMILSFVVINFSVGAQTLIGSGVDYKEPKAYRIAGISVVGAKYSDVQAIKLFSGLQEGQEVLIPGDAITDAIRKLWKQKLFSNIKIEVAEFRGQDVYLAIYLDEQPRMARYSFEGVKKSEAENLREKLDIRTGIVCNENLKSNSVNIIKNYYIEKGFYNANISVIELPDEIMQNSVKLIFKIDHGNRVKVEDITFIGVSQISEKKLRRTMKNTKERNFFRVFKASKFIESEYKDDKAKIIAKYNKEGF
jgi:outer membrane protein insertion porin family